MKAHKNNNSKIKNSKGKPSAFGKDIQTVRKGFHLPVTTIKEMGIAKAISADEDFSSTDVQFVNEAILFFCRHIREKYK